jgi:hypothetical protein
MKETRGRKKFSQRSRFCVPESQTRLPCDGTAGLHWEALDADFRVSGLLAGVFGTKAYMARRAGQAKSPAKSAAARANGTKGGRPRKQA